MVAALQPSPSPSLAVVGFTQVPNTVLLDPTLSRDARFLYTLLLQHARPRTGYVVRVGYARLCALMDAGEDLVRQVMRELVAAGLVEQTRRGRGLVNTYRLLVTPFLSTRPVRVLEPGERGFSIEEQEIEEDEGEFESSIASPSINFPDRPPHPFSPEPVLHLSLPNPAPRRTARPRALADPERDAVLALIGDIRRELGDRATVGSTTSRALTLYRQSDVSWEAFVTAVYSARAATQARTSAIRRRDEGGVNKMPYMLAVLADRLGLRETPIPECRRWRWRAWEVGRWCLPHVSLPTPQVPPGGSSGAGWRWRRGSAICGPIVALAGVPHAMTISLGRLGMCGSVEGTRAETGAGGERCASAPPLPPRAGQPASARGLPLACRAGGHAARSPHSHAAARVVGDSMDGDARASPRAAATPHLGAFIAVLDLPDNGQVGIARTGQRAGHSTVWGDADALRTAVVAVLPVASEEERHA